MGGSSSTRKISMDNDHEPATVIKISEKVVQRISSSEVEREVAQDFKDMKTKVRIGRHSENSKSNFFEDGVPFVTARMIRQEVENELQKNNKYWETRIAALQVGHEKINTIMEEEYMKTVEEMKKTLPKLPPKDLKLPCQDKKGSIISCYKLNSKRPLLCAQEVEAFNCCMRNTRVNLINEKA